MPAAILKQTILVASLVVASSIVVAQTSDASKSERGLPETTGKPLAKSERALPTQSKPAATPPARNERAMTVPKK